MLKRSLVCFIVIISMFLNLFFIMPVFADLSDEGFDAVTAAKIQAKTNVFELKAKAALLMDAATGQILIENNSHEKLPIASVTKVMSMLLIMEAIDSGKIKYEDKVSVSEHAYNMGGSQAYIEPGEEFTVHEMLKAVAIHSSNDVTAALAEFVAGSEDAFVKMMNDRAKSLGMVNTNFLDCTGLTDEGHYSTAYDIAVMSRELINKHPKILEYTGTWHDTFRNGTFSLDNTNKLIWYYKGADGLKTGHTNKAGFCLSATAVRNNLRLISVVLGEPDNNTRVAESRKLLDHGFANYEINQLNNKGELVQSVDVKKGVKTKVNAVYGDDVKLLIGKGEKEKVTREVIIEPDLKAPIKSDQKIGEVIFKVGDKQVGKTDLIAENNIEKASFIRLFFRMVIGWFGIGKGE